MTSGGSTAGGDRPAVEPNGAGAARVRRATTRGLAWMFGATAVQMWASLGAQVVLGLLLSDRDFGLYAIAIGASLALQSLRDGGARVWLLRETPEVFARWIHTGFALILLSSLVMAVALAASSPFVAALYGEPELTGLLLTIAATLPLGAYPAITSAELQSNLQFAALSKITMASSVARHSSVIALALLGFGPYSFVLPVFLVHVVESIGGYRCTRYVPARAARRDVRQLFRMTRWVLVGTLLSALTTRGDYLALGLVASTAAVGVYYFAFTLAWQIVLFVMNGTRRVLVSALARAEEAGAFEQLAMSGLRVTALLACGLSGLLVAGAADIEELLWSGRWAAAVPSIRILAVALSIEVVALLGETILLSAGQFRRWTATVLVRAIGLVTAAFVGGAVFGSRPTAIAAVVAVELVVVDGAVLWKTLGWVGVRRIPFLTATAFAFAIAGAAAIAAYALAELLTDGGTVAHLLVIVTAYVPALVLLGMRAVKGSAGVLSRSPLNSSPSQS